MSPHFASLSDFEPFKTVSPWHSCWRSIIPIHWSWSDFTVHGIHV